MYIYIYIYIYIYLYIYVYISIIYIYIGEAPYFPGDAEGKVWCPPKKKEKEMSPRLIRPPPPAQHALLATRPRVVCGLNLSPRQTAPSSQQTDSLTARRDTPPRGARAQSNNRLPTAKNWYLETGGIVRTPRGAGGVPRSRGGGGDAPSSSSSVTQAHSSGTLKSRPFSAPVRT